MSFDDLLGSWGKNHLRYDFGIYSPDGELKLLMECQGQQHYKPVEEFGGKSTFDQQAKNDDMKRRYASDHEIPLVEIPYTCNTYAKEEEFLLKKGIIMHDESNPDDIVDE